MPECPICANPAAPKYRPFCSRRCADVDLGKWMTGAYTLPSEDPVEPEDLIAALEAEAKSAGDRSGD